MIPLLELEDKDFKWAILAMFKDVKEMMLNRWISAEKWML